MHPEQTQNIKAEEFSQKILNLMPFQFRRATDMPLKTGVNIKDKMQMFFKVQTSVGKLTDSTNSRPPIKVIVTLVADNDELNHGEITKNNNNPEHSLQVGTKELLQQKS